jgi:nucleoside-diphosphate-sugar epimerase
MRVLVTGANGFVGRSLCGCLNTHGHVVVPAVRRVSGLVGETVVGCFDGATDWTSVLEACDVVVHLAARVHVMNDRVQDPLVLYRATNTDATLNLARQAVAAGVKRFVFISSIKVNGEGRELPYSEFDLPSPQDAYAISKWEAEQGLRAIESSTGMQVVILRPPLVYGPGVGANFLRLMRSVERGLPLPFGRVDNRRSLLYLGNFTDAIRVCLDHPAAAGQTFLLSDGEDVSSADLIRRLALAMHRPARLLPLPPSWLRAAGVLFGRGAEVDRLLGSLSVDSSKIRRELGWRPPFSMDEGLSQTADYYFRHIDK